MCLFIFTHIDEAARGIGQCLGSIAKELPRLLVGILQQLRKLPAHLRNLRREGTVACVLVTVEGASGLLNRDCPIWLLDEPLNGLDSQAQTAFETLIARHCAAGGVAIAASHQPIALPAPAIIDLAEYAA